MKERMVLSTTTEHCFALFGPEEGVKMLAEVGFDALDMNFCNMIDTEAFSEENYVATCEKLLRTAKECGIYFNQAHAPEPGYIFYPEQERRDAYVKAMHPKIIRSIRAAGLLGAEQIIVHPLACPDLDKQKEYNIAYYNSLLPYAKEAGIKIALENMWGVSQVNRQQIMANVCSFGRDLAEYYEALDPEWFTVCLDIGHCGLVGESADNAIRALGGRLHALHVHDNDHVHDLHTLPYVGKVDWKAVTAALAEVDYNGDFTYEVGGSFLTPYVEDKVLMRKAFELMEVTGRKLISMIYAAKQ